MKISPPTILSSSVYGAKPIVTKTRHHRPQDVAFVESKKTACSKRALCVFPRLPGGLMFLSLGTDPSHGDDWLFADNKLSYVQQCVCLPEYARPACSSRWEHNFLENLFEICKSVNPTPSLGHVLYRVRSKRSFLEFTRFTFGVKNAEPVFQPERTHPNTDDVIIKRKSEKQHQEKLRNFLKAAMVENLTLHKAKRVFASKTVPMLGHIWGAGSKRPDSNRIKSLMDIPIPEISTQLKRLLRFFAYNAKWFTDYSNETARLLAAQEQLAFPLNQASCLAIATPMIEVASAVLWLPRANKPHVLRIGESGSGVRCRATHSQGDKPVGFFSRTLKLSKMA